MSEYQLNEPTVSAYTENLMLKLLLEHKGFNEVFSINGWNDNDIASALGLPNEMDGVEGIRPKIYSLLQERYKIIQKSTALVPETMRLAYRNIDKLAEFIQLNETEKTIFTFIMHLRAESILCDLFCRLPKVDLNRAIICVSKLLNLKERDVRLALHNKQKLTSYNLIDRGYSPDRVDCYFDWGRTLDFDDFMTQSLDEDVLLSCCALPTKVPTLGLAQFDHITEMRSMMLDYLKYTFENKRKGVNFLLYGLPGTGKTEFAALLAKTLDVPSYTITYMDKDGDLSYGSKRLENCRLANTLLENKPALMIFDEIEDVFSAGLFERSTAQENKAWVNELLENNNNPMIWISNSVSGMDPAFLRRFDLVFEMPNLPVKTKFNLIKEKINERLTEEYVQVFSQVKDLTPAMITRSLNVVSALNPKPNEFANQILTILNQNLLAQGKKKIELPSNKKLAYDLNWVSCHDDIHRITEGLKQTKSGRICCYGPPGTGKTAWASWLAEELEMPLLLLKGSDLLDKYVGETEKQIAEAFNRARENNMLLVLDEVDTFLFARDSAQRSWERSQVNEMLTQIERFEGLMVVSTNLIDVLDPAALRRFDLKLKFDYLQRDQVCALASEQAKKLGLNLKDMDFVRLGQLRYLTPGDFAAVARRHRFSPFSDADSWIDALQGECDLKGVEPSRGIGF